MNMKKAGSILAVVLLAAGMMLGVCGCGDAKVQEIMQQMPSGESSEENSSGEESVSASLESEVESVAALHAVDELEAYALEYIKAGVSEEMGLSADLAKDAMLDYAVQDIQEDRALIRYYIEASDHSIYVVDETVSLSGKNRDYQVARESLQSYVSITDSSMYSQLHGPDGVGNKSTGYNVTFFRGIMRDMITAEAPVKEMLAKRYSDPVEVAVNLLHLGPGKGEVTSEVIRPQINPDSWAEGLNKEVLLEGTTATVTYTFDKDGSVVEIPMEVIESGCGIWAPSEGNWGRQVYRTCEAYSERDHAYFDIIHNSSYGIYVIKDGGIRCVYPYYTAPDISVKNIYGEENLICFMADSMHQEKNLEYQADCFVLLDLITGQMDMESMRFPEKFSYDQDVRFCAGDSGFWEIGEDYVPEVNVRTQGFPGGVTYNGKSVADLSEAEQNAYGCENRSKLLAEPGKVLKLSLRTMTQTYAYVDLDGDGVTEKIVLKPGNSPNAKNLEVSYDWFRLIVGDSDLEGQGCSLHNNIYAFSLDGKEILLCLMEDGPSDDPYSSMYAYRDGALVEVGEIPRHMGEGDIRDGYIHDNEKTHLIQSDYIYVRWQMNSQGMLEKVYQDTYEYTLKNDVILKCKLPVHSEPDMKAMSHEISPQKVKFLRVDDTMSWAYVQGENGEAGWVYVEAGNVVELGASGDCDEIFEGLLLFE